jgi:diacylglycerol kinase (ATP)
VVKLKAALVVNPASANGATGRRWPEMAEVINREGISFEYRFTESPGHATEITRQFLKDGQDLIIAVGGDGTTNEVVNGFFDPEHKAIRPGAAISFISGGTGRDLIRTVGIPTDTTEAVKHIISSPVRPIDLGRVSFVNNQGFSDIRHFINVAGLGLDGATVNRVNKTSKALGGFVSFLWATVATLVLYKNQNMKIAVDGLQVCDEPVTVVVFGNGRYFGGGMHIAPNAKLDDGYFDIVILKDLSKVNLLLSLPRVYKGTHLSHPRITSLRGKAVKVTADESALLDLDGEQPGCAPVEIELLPRAINLKG